MMFSVEFRTGNRGLLAYRNHAGAGNSIIELLIDESRFAIIHDYCDDPIAYELHPLTVWTIQKNSSQTDHSVKVIIPHLAEICLILASTRRSWPQAERHQPSRGNLFSAVSRQTDKWPPLVQVCAPHRHKKKPLHTSKVTARRGS